jgi:ATP-dependent Zn protease
VSEGTEYREGTAFHEAGHAVVGAALGLTIRYASIVPSDGYAGEVEFEDELTNPEDNLVLSLAGGFAVEMQEGQEWVDIEVSPTNFYGPDWSDISERVAELADGEPDEERRVIYETAEKAGRILSKNWNSVRALAEALMANGHLEGDRIRSLLRLDDLYR